MERSTYGSLRTAVGGRLGRYLIAKKTGGSPGDQQVRPTGA